MNKDSLNVTRTDCHTNFVKGNDKSCIGKIRWISQEDGKNIVISRDSLIFDGKHDNYKQPFETTAGLSDLLSNRGKLHTEEAVMYVSSHGEGSKYTEEISSKTSLKIPILQSTMSYLYATELPTATLENVITNSIREPFKDPEDATTKILTSSNVNNILLQFAIGIQEYHNNSILSLSVTPKDLLIHYGRTFDFGTVRLNENSMVSTKTVVSGQLSILSNAPRCDPYYRPPEGFVRAPIDTMVIPTDPSSDIELGSVKEYFTFTDKFDVWSLGICFILALTKRGVYRIALEKGLMSEVAYDSIMSYINKMKSKQPDFETDENVKTFIYRECVAWQSMVLFGSPDVFEDETGPTRRKEFLNKIINDALDEDVNVKRSEAHLWIDLLFRMLAPNHISRISISEVIAHPVFSDSRNKVLRTETIFLDVAKNRSKKFIPSPLRLETLYNTEGMQFRPYNNTEWTNVHDAGVVQTLRRLVYDPVFSHLPVVAAFVAYDNAARIAAALSASELNDRTLMVAAIASAIKLSFLLYDSASSLFENPTVAISQTNTPLEIEYAPNVTSKAISLMDPVVMEYIGFDLRRGENYIFGHLDASSRLGISSSFSSEVYDIFNMMINASGRKFRESYLVLDVPEFVSIRFGIGSNSMISSHPSVRSERNSERVRVPDSIANIAKKRHNIPPHTIGDLVKSVKIH